MLCWFALLLVVIVSVSPACVGNGTSITGKEKDPAGTCIKEVRITRGQNHFREWDASPAGSKLAGAPVRAADVEGSDFDTPPELSRYTFGSGRLMGIERKTREPVVSSRCFSPLARVDATRIEAGQRREIGKLLCGSGKDLSYQDIVFFLLESQIITTYWHIESVICLVSQNDSQDAYKASFRGSHIYFTNSRNEDKLDFSISIEKKTGTISLLGGS
jgi:hypothetical protein